MKKISIFLLFIMVFCSVAFVSVSCNQTDKISKMKRTLEEAESLTITFKATFDEEQEKYIFRYEDNKMQIVGGEYGYEGEFYEIDENNNYIHHYFLVSNNKWAKITTLKPEDGENDFSNEIWKGVDIDELFNPENYDVVEGEKNTFKIKEDIILENLEDIVLIYGKDKYTIKSDNVEIIFSRINKTYINLPSVEQNTIA